MPAPRKYPLELKERATFSWAAILEIAPRRVSASARASNANRRTSRVGMSRPTWFSASVPQKPRTGPSPVTGNLNEEVKW